MKIAIKKIRGSFQGAFRAQSIIEYSILIAIVVAVFMAMQTYIKRTVQQGIRISADQLGSQEKGMAKLDPREDALRNRQITGSSNSQSSLNIQGESRRTDINQTTRQDSISTAAGKDAGWYYIKAGNQWKLHRQGD